MPRAIRFDPSTTCDVCMRRNVGAAVIETPERAPIAMCRECVLDAATLTLSAPRGAKRPHKAPCACMECCAYDRGAVPDTPHALTVERAAVDRLLDDTIERAHRLEIDP